MYKHHNMDRVFTQTKEENHTLGDGGRGNIQII